MSRLIAWNGLAIVGWLWAVPFAVTSKARTKLLGPQAPFLIAWLGPGLLFQGLIHVADPGHTLFSVPGLCLLGGYVIWAASEHLGREPQRLADAALAGAVILNVLLFTNVFPFPVSGGRVKMALAFGTYETSLGYVRQLDSIHKTTYDEWWALATPDRRSIIVTTDETPKNWFMHWLMLRYYAPDTDIWVLAEGRTPRQVLHVRRNKTLATRTGEVIDVPVPAGGRIIWVLEPGGAFQAALDESVKPERRTRVSFTDVSATAVPFQVLNFRFVPEAQ